MFSARIKSNSVSPERVGVNLFTLPPALKEVTVNISRYLKPELIKMEMQTHLEFDPEIPINPQRRLWETKTALLQELVDLLILSEKIGNKNKLFTDLYNRERKATTGIGKGFAVPHVRTMQAKEFILGVGRSPSGYDFDSLDGKPVHVFFVMVAPPYDDNLYLKVFKSLAELLQFDYLKDDILSASSEHEVIRAIKKLE